MLKKQLKFLLRPRTVHFGPKNGILSRDPVPLWTEIAKGSNSYMTNGLIIYGKIFAHFLIY